MADAGSADASVPDAGAPDATVDKPIHLVQEESTVVSPDGNSFSIAWPTPTTTGNVLVLVVSVGWDTIGTISPPEGWTLLDSQDVSGWNSWSTAVYIREDAPSQSGDVTVSIDKSGFAADLSLLEYEGMAADPVDQHTASSGTSSLLDSGWTASTSQTDELWLVVASNLHGWAQCTPTPGYSIATEAWNAAGHQTVYAQIAHSTGSARLATQLIYSQVGPWSCVGDPVSTPWVGIAATFKGH